MNDIAKAKLKATAEALAKEPSPLNISTALSYAFYLGCAEGNDIGGKTVLNAFAKAQERIGG